MESNEEELVKLYCIYLHQDDAKKNTAMRLAKFNLLEIKHNLQECPRNAIILNPFAEKVISFFDHQQLMQNGLIVIDCSWEQIDMSLAKMKNKGRKLPALLAANTINYGKWEKLSSAEALAAALIIGGYVKQAYQILDKFAWGESFLQINQTIFDKLNMIKDEKN